MRIVNVQIKLRRDVQCVCQCPSQLSLELVTAATPISPAAASQALRLIAHTHDLPLNDLNLTSSTQLAEFVSCRLVALVGLPDSKSGSNDGYIPA